MSSKILDSLVEELEEKLGRDRTLITIRQLVACGIFGSMSSAREALAKGRLPFIRISPRRFAIPRKALLAFLYENLKEKACSSE